MSSVTPFKADHETLFSVKSTLEEVPEATSKLFDFLKPLNLNESDRFDLRLSFEEILINSMKHGNHYDPSLSVCISMAYNASEIQIKVTDEGNGFDVEALGDPTSDQQLEAYSGRGVYLVKHLMDKMTYLDNGRSVEIVKKYQNQNQIS